jgi:hypothetical protein
VTLTFNNQLTRARTGNAAYDVHLQPTGTLVPFPMQARCRSYEVQFSDKF